MGQRSGEPKRGSVERGLARIGRPLNLVHRKSGETVKTPVEEKNKISTTTLTTAPVLRFRGSKASESAPFKDSVKWLICMFTFTYNVLYIYIYIYIYIYDSGELPRAGRAQSPKPFSGPSRVVCGVAAVASAASFGRFSLGKRTRPPEL